MGQSRCGLEPLARTLSEEETVASGKAWGENQDKSYFLKKNYKFKDFAESQNIVNEVGKIAETENHHPDIHFGWGYAQVIIFTHAIKGLAESDFILASKIDQIKIN